jgi:FkbM family methyltransferase
MIVLDKIPVKGIIQVGANDGREINQFINYTKNIICFEPVLEARNRCSQRASQFKNTNIIISDYIISNKIGETEFYVGKESQNSSLFDLNPQRSAIHQRNQHDKKIILNSITLDEYFNITPTVNKENYNYLYIDVQGAEHLVLEGATQILKQIDYIWMEVSYFDIYLGTMLFDDITKLLDNLGYELYHHKEIIEGQGDALYIKKQLI